VPPCERPPLSASADRCLTLGLLARHLLQQIEQLAIIADFKAGKYNVLVATCIGEEGLDIGSVDRIFCYDVPGSSIRLVRRPLLKADLITRAAADLQPRALSCNASAGPDVSETAR
jgi:excinuclease UvrABC helicase subunit UvrB